MRNDVIIEMEYEGQEGKDTVRVYRKDRKVIAERGKWKMEVSLDTWNVEINGRPRNELSRSVEMVLGFCYFSMTGLPFLDFVLEVSNGDCGSDGSIRSE